MSCGKTNCTCCRDSYLLGVQDGLEVGLKRGYITGYAHAVLQVPPPPDYLKEIERAIEETQQRYLNSGDED